MNTRDALGRTGLFLQAAAGNLNKVKLMSAHGADVNLASVDGATPLFAAAMGGHAAVCQHLIEVLHRRLPSAIRPIGRRPSS